MAQIPHLLRPSATICIATMCAAAAKHRALTGSKPDDRPFMWCGDPSDYAIMVLCDCCNACYRPQCAADSNRTKVHGGPWFCHACKGFLELWGAPEMTQEWALMDYLWTVTLPQDPDKCHRLIKLGETYHA